jgi:hypothetical protein
LLARRGAAIFLSVSLQIHHLFARHPCFHVSSKKAFDLLDLQRHMLGQRGDPRWSPRMRVCRWLRGAQLQPPYEMQ